MDFMFIVSECVACERIISYNPERVPSLRINGSREPLCRLCFIRWNQEHRISKGLEPVFLHPDAYAPVKVS